MGVTCAANRGLCKGEGGSHYAYLHACIVGVGVQAYAAYGGPCQGEGGGGGGGGHTY